MTFAPPFLFSFTFSLFHPFIPCHCWLIDTSTLHTSTHPSLIPIHLGSRSTYTSSYPSSSPWLPSIYHFLTTRLPTRKQLKRRHRYIILAAMSYRHYPPSTPYSPTWCFLTLWQKSHSCPDYGTFVDKVQVFAFYSTHSDPKHPFHLSNRTYHQLQYTNQSTTCITLSSLAWNSYPSTLIHSSHSRMFSKTTPMDLLG